MTTDNHDRLLNPQVDKDHYYGKGYLTPRRFASYGHQLQEIAALEPKNVLEVGVGNGVVPYMLRGAGFDVTTLDFDPALEPDVVASVTDMPFGDGAFDIVACFEVLEHIPWDRMPQALGEIQRVCRRYALISVPDAREYFLVHIPGLISRRLFKRPFWKPHKHQFDGEHYWEINTNSHSLNAFVERIKAAGFEMERTFRAWEMPEHRFFRLRAVAGPRQPIQ